MSDLLRDQRYMKIALSLAKRGMGATYPNPSVGCILVKNNKIIARGRTAAGGRPHAERITVDQAGDAAKGADVYVTLEPCSHKGVTSPCVNTLIKAGIKRVVIAHKDPDARVAGKGVEALRQAGIKVVENICQEEAAKINCGFFSRELQNRPHIALKIASTLDGKIATEAGESQWITGSAARRAGHMLRSSYDAILIGTGTLQADDPSLTCRVSGLEGSSPLRIILDAKLIFPSWSQLAKTAHQNSVWVLYDKKLVKKEQDKIAKLAALGVEVFGVKTNSQGYIDVKSAMQLLAEKGLTRILVEGGGKVHASFLNAKMVDVIYWFSAAGIMGAEGMPAIGAMGLKRLKQMSYFSVVTQQQLGQDMLTLYRAKPTSGFH